MTPTTTMPANPQSHSTHSSLRKLNLKNYAAPGAPSPPVHHALDDHPPSSDDEILHTPPPATTSPFQCSSFSLCLSLSLFFLIHSFFSFPFPNLKSPNYIRSNPYSLLFLLLLFLAFLFFQHKSRINTQHPLTSDGHFPSLLNLTRICFFVKADYQSSSCFLPPLDRFSNPKESRASPEDVAKHPREEHEFTSQEWPVKSC